MKIAISTSHLYGLGGGFQTVKAFSAAFLALGHEVTCYVTNNPSEEVLRRWDTRIPIRFYSTGIERDYDFHLGVDHFKWFQPLAKRNAAFVFFPQDKLPTPPEGISLYSVSDYTQRYMRIKWGVESQTMYLPIDASFSSRDKENIILHVSRFAEPNEYADKGHRQMIQAFKFLSRNMKDWKLVLAGSLDIRQEFYLNELLRSAQGYNIDFMPNITDGQMVDLMSRSAIYWHATGVSLSTIPGAQEHLGLSPLEAQASGCVPIVYNSGGSPEVVLNHKTGLLFDNIMDLPQMTLELTRNGSAWAQMSQAAQRWSRSWSDFDAFVQRVDDMLNDRPITPLQPFQMVLRHSPAEVTAVIPTYNSPLLQQCLDSLKQTAPLMKVLVINNGDPLQDLRVDNNVTVYEAGENLGFARANHLAASMVQTPLVLMLNDDVIADRTNWLENLLFIMNNDTVGVVGSKLYFPDGRLQFAGGAIDWNRDDIGYHIAYGQPDSMRSSVPHEVDFVTGACLLVRRELYEMPDELLEGLNYEEPWLCFAAREKGYKIIYQPASALIHHEGQTKQRSQDVLEKIERNKAEFKKRWMK